MSPAVTVTVTMLVLAAAGLLPVLLLVGPRLVALPLFPLAGAALCGAAAACSIALSWSLLQWFVLLSGAAFLLSLGVFIRRPERARRLLLGLRRGVRPLVALGGVVVLAAVAWTLRPLRVPSVGFDSRAIWILHARWLRQGHTFELAAIRNHFLVLSHPGYPPLVSAVMALAWRVSGTSSDRVAVATVAVLNGCALLVAGWGIVEAARRAALRLHPGAGPSRLVTRPRLLLGVGIVLAALAVLVAGGVVGTFATNGYADPLWSLAAVSIVVFGLVL
ncbi:MAG TPA: hypothetical protein VG298_00080, partial [Acidimicrobiales bacterium]|nr:hypothetical protein [Acidimicrobiales bacterium]